MKERTKDVLAEVVLADGPANAVAIASFLGERRIVVARTLQALAAKGLIVKTGQLARKAQSTYAITEAGLRVAGGWR